MSELQIEYWALIISGIAMLLTCVNVVVALLECCNRSGKKLSCMLLQHCRQSNTSIKNGFLIVLTNHKTSNIAIIEISYIQISDVKNPIKKQLFPTIDSREPQLLSGNETIYLPANDIEANDIVINQKEPYYVRIKTSKGIYTIDERRLSFFKKFRWYKTSVRAIEKLVADQEKQVIKNGQQKLNIK